MKEFILDLEYLAEGLFWYFFYAFEPVGDEIVALGLLFVAVIEEFVGFLFCQLLIV